MLNIEVQTPLHGAAFRVLYEDVQPAFCSSRVRQAEILKRFSEVRLWAGKQPPDIRAAYEWAIAKLTADIERQCAAQDMGNKVQAVYATIPRPETA